MVSGGLGALMATTPVQVALQITDWRGVFIGLAGFALVAAAVVFFVVPDQPRNARCESFAEQLGGIKLVLTDRRFWRIAPWALSTQASYLSIQGLWSGPWLRDVVGLEQTEVAQVLWWVAIAMIAGYFFFGRLTGQLAKRGVSPATVATWGMLIFMFIQLALVLFPAHIFLLWSGFGFFGTVGILPYAVLSQIFPIHLTGRCNTSLNLLVFVAAFSGQWMIGAVIGLWPQNADGGYSPEGYQAAFLMLIVCQLCAALWYALSARKPRTPTG
jgi:predicted MFS family arabinose efflux permease